MSRPARALGAVLAATAATLALSTLPASAQTTTAAAISDSTIASVAKQAGFPSNQIATAVAVALAESGGRPDAANWHDPYGGSHGLFQINGSHRAFPEWASRYVPLANAKMAYRIWSGTGTWRAWGAYTNGSYRGYTQRGAAAAAKLGSYASPTKTVAATTAYPVYLVQRGDTLARIALRFCGRTSAYPNLARASGITNPNLIYAGRTRVVRNCGATALAAPRPTTTSSASRTARINTVIGYAKAQLGDRYVYGTAGPNTYDCSGLTMAAYARIGVRLGRSAKQQSTNGRAVSLNALLPGDILWHTGYPSYHVTMYIGGGQIVAADHSGTRVRIRAFRAGEWSGARRIIP